MLPQKRIINPSYTIIKYKVSITSIFGLNYEIILTQHFFSYTDKKNKKNLQKQLVIHYFAICIINIIY